MNEALQRIRCGSASCVVVSKGQIIHAADGRGVSPLLKLYGDAPEKLKNSFVLDKIVGKAAAAILILGGARKVYGEIMSAAARDYLIQHNISPKYDRVVDAIANRSGDGICPLELSVSDVDDPKECLARITETIKSFVAQAE
jgi:hypothetical protein